MALRTFETADAKYYLGLGNHATSSAPIFEDVDPKSLDFLVLEAGNLRTARAIREFRQYSNLCSKFEHETKIYSVDCKVTALSDLLTSAITITPFLLSSSPWAILPIGLALSYCSNNNQNLRILPWMNSVYTNIVATPGISFRDAIAAKKVGEHLVPKHKHKDGSKVQVGILYGAAHSGIETKLKHPWIADATIQLYHNWLRFSTRKELNEVREIVPGQEEFVKYDCGLFK